MPVCRRLESATYGAAGVALLEAGASVSDAPFPSGYDEVDELIRS